MSAKLKVNIIRKQIEFMVGELILNNIDFEIKYEAGNIDITTLGVNYVIDLSNIGGENFEAYTTADNTLYAIREIIRQR